MSLVKSTTYAPDIFNTLRGILLVHKPAGIHPAALIGELKDRISDQLNELNPRPLASRLVIDGGIHEEKKLNLVLNLADHPLVSGPRYNPWEIKMVTMPIFLTSRMSGVMPLIVGPSIKFFKRKFFSVSQVNIYQITGQFGYTTDNMFGDGKIIDKANFKHIRPWKIDHALARIEGSQKDRLFDSAAVPLDSQEAYELARAWPSQPPKGAKWPVIYRIRCIHFNLPEFKIEVTVMNENEAYLAQIVQDLGQALKSSAHTASIRRVKHGLFDISDCLTSSEWDLQSIVNNLKIHQDFRKLHDYLFKLKGMRRVSTEHEIKQVPIKISQNQ